MAAGQLQAARIAPDLVPHGCQVREFAARALGHVQPAAVPGRKKPVVSCFAVFALGLCVYMINSAASFYITRCRVQ